MRKLRKENVPNQVQYQPQYHEYRRMNKRKIRRFVLVFLFLLVSSFYIQSILSKQDEMIKAKYKTIQQQKEDLLSLEKDKYYLKNVVNNLKDDEEQILKFARKEYQFSKPNETVFVIPK
ncbi:FtsB family cell division protein [Bacillus cereus]|uniref:FtsB family cell division protein n=1 Tax=Bacillus cereus TaxID=1396 RepID=UPI000BF88E99|nr:septum formation initiator family protein [Bacillus cereus]PFO75687.1 cell division protein DIVIC [Bacillus cereus]